MACQSPSKSFHLSTSNFFQLRGPIRDLIGLFTLLESVGVVAGFQDVAVVGDAVQEGCGRLSKSSNSGGILMTRFMDWPGMLE